MDCMILLELSLVPPTIGVLDGPSPMSDNTVGGAAMRLIRRSAFPMG